MSTPVNLWLDDVRPAPQGWVHAKTAADARAVVSSRPVHQMSLDHDLGTYDTGMGFVEWLAKTRKWPATKPQVHSANPGGAASMRALIDRAWNPGAAPGRAVHATKYHQGCADAACCACTCPDCMAEWRTQGRPGSTDCGVHGQRTP